MMNPSIHASLSGTNMKTKGRSGSGALRPLRLAAFVALVAACGKNDPGRVAKSPSPSPKASPAAAPAGWAFAASVPHGGEGLPSWARERPHFFDQNGRRFASAVGHAQIGNLALARMAAQDRARADILRLIQGNSAASSAEGTLRGARVTDFFASRKGQVYVRVEAEAERPSQ